MKHVLFWLYFVNVILLICHEIESAYWKEWELFKLKGGLSGFILLHIPLLAIVLWGLIEVYQSTVRGLVLSIVLAGCGIFAFFIHTHFIRRGNKEFTLLISRFLLSGMLMISIAQSGTAIACLVQK